MVLDVYEAVTSRRAVRDFTDRDVRREVLERVLSVASRAPSASNLQPWHACVLTGAPPAELKKRTGERVAGGDPWDEPQYRMYPATLKSPYRERRSAFGEERYGALGIQRGDLEARQRAAAANRDCFGAPAALFCYVDRDMGPPQWSDVGMHLQTVMLLLRADGLHSRPQMAWAKYHRTVAALLSAPDELVLFRGRSVGFEDVTGGQPRTGRVPLGETVAFVEELREDRAPEPPAIPLTARRVAARPCAGRTARPGPCRRDGLRVSGPGLYHLDDSAATGTCPAEATGTPAAAGGGTSSLRVSGAPGTPGADL